MTDISARKGNGESNPPPTLESVSSPELDAVIKWVSRERDLYRGDLEALVQAIEMRFEKEGLAVKNEELAQKQREDEDKKEKARAALRKAREKWDPVRPLGFIVVALAAWWLILLLANLAITCVPGGAPCGPAGPLVPSMTMSRPQWILILISVVAALWVSKMMIYPNRDFADQ